MCWSLVYGAPLLKAIQLLPKAFRIKSNLPTVLYKALMAQVFTCPGALTFLLPLCPSVHLFLPTQVWASSPLFLQCSRQFLLGWSQIKCCFIREPFPTTPCARLARLSWSVSIHAPDPSCNPLTNVCLYWLFIRLPHQHLMSMTTGFMHILSTV